MIGLFEKEEIMMKEFYAPLDIPQNFKNLYIKNYNKITKKTGKLILFAADHKIEHLNDDFFGKNIPLEVNNPKYLFRLGSSDEVGAFATQLGLVAKYGFDYPNANYIIKLNSKTNINKNDPLSKMLWTIDDVIEFKKNSALNICGVAYTVYLGSCYEEQMMREAAQVIFKAHLNGLIAVLWVYIRGKGIINLKKRNLTAGAAGVALCLGADFAKIHAIDSKELRVASEAGGRTKLICAGGEKTAVKKILTNLVEQIKIGGIKGCAIGRNIFQRPFNEALALLKAISAIVYESKELSYALNLYDMEVKKIRN